MSAIAKTIGLAALTTLIYMGTAPQLNLPTPNTFATTSYLRSASGCTGYYLSGLDYDPIVKGAALAGLAGVVIGLVHNSFRKEEEK